MMFCKDNSKLQLVVISTHSVLNEAEHPNENSALAAEAAISKLFIIPLSVGIKCKKKIITCL